MGEVSKCDFTTQYLSATGTLQDSICEQLGLYEIRGVSKYDFTRWQESATLTLGQHLIIWEESATGTLKRCEEKANVIYKMGGVSNIDFTRWEDSGRMG